MQSSITRYRESPALVRLARVTSAVESGFIAAGITICFVATVETLATLLGWISSL